MPKRKKALLKKLSFIFFFSPFLYAFQCHMIFFSSFAFIWLDSFIVFPPWKQCDVILCKVLLSLFSFCLFVSLRFSFYFRSCFFKTKGNNKNMQKLIKLYSYPVLSMLWCFSMWIQHVLVFVGQSKCLQNYVPWHPFCGFMSFLAAAKFLK